jgi:hypothetical protein
MSYFKMNSLITAEENHEYRTPLTRWRVVKFNCRHGNERKSRRADVLLFVMLTRVAGAAFAMRVYVKSAQPELSLLLHGCLPVRPAGCVSLSGALVPSARDNLLLVAVREIRPANFFSHFYVHLLGFGEVKLELNFLFKKLRKFSYFIRKKKHHSINHDFHNFLIYEIKITG